MEYLLTRLDEKILSLNKASKKALVAYLVAGDPDLDMTLELMHGFVNAGVDILEIGVPFTDPIAEGPIIQAAHAEYNERVGENFEYVPLLGDRDPPLDYRN